MDKARVEFRGDAGTPIRYEDIMLWRDVVFLESVYHYDEENQSYGAPAVGTFYFTGYLREREGIHFVMTYFSLVVADGHLPITNGTRILADGGANSHPLRYDEKNMRFWRTGRLEVTPSVAEQERNHIEDEAEVSRGSEAGGRVGHHHPAQDGTWNARAKAIRSRACLVPRMQEVEHRFRKPGPAPSPASIAHIRGPVPKVS
jgi:hypothetical protein